MRCGASKRMRTTGKPRASGEPAEATARKIAILIDLIRNGRLAVAKVEQRFNISDRQASRDFQELRKIGKTMGFEIGKKNAAGQVELKAFAKRPREIVAGERDTRALIAELFKAFGQPLESFAGGFEEDEGSFVQVVMPGLVDGSKVRSILEALRDAWSANARVRFRYKGKERVVEPFRVMVRSGRYYLVGRLVGARPNDWRMFSLDEISGAVARAGTFTPSGKPGEYASSDAVGFIKTGRKAPVEVTVSQRFAKTAASRLWQAGQRIVEHPDGTATLFFEVGDVDEAIRWALGYGEEAWITGPPSAVARTKELLASMADRYR